MQTVNGDRNEINIDHIVCTFPYLHHQRYPITLENCETEHIVVKDKGDPLRLRCLI